MGYVRRLGWESPAREVQAHDGGRVAAVDAHYASIQSSSGTVLTRSWRLLHRLV